MPPKKGTNTKTSDSIETGTENKVTIEIIVSF